MLPPRRIGSGGVQGGVEFAFGIDFMTGATSQQ